MQRPAQSFLDGLEEIVTAAARDGMSPAYFPLLDKLDPALIDCCRKALKRSEEFAYRFLSQHMLKGRSQKARAVARELNAVAKHLSHGAVIDAEKAASMGLNVLLLDPQDDRWQAYWRLYCLARLALLERNPGARLYEGAEPRLSSDRAPVARQ